MDLREYGVIFQDYMRYELLVKENIGFGKFEHLDREATIEAAARKSLTAAVIAKLPNGFDQMIGRRFDRRRRSLDLTKDRMSVLISHRFSTVASDGFRLAEDKIRAIKVVKTPLPEDRRRTVFGTLDF